MARDRSPIVKQSRREGFALHPKAHKILVKKSSAPGQHGSNRHQKGSLYSIQLREKQKVRRLYGLLERQFAKLIKEATRKNGLTGENLLQFLELRLDNAVYRAGFALSRQSARQLVGHGHFELNNRKVDIPSIRLKPGDKITVRAKSKKSEYFSNIDEIVANSIKIPISWLDANSKKLEISVTDLPKREETDPDINEQLIVEYYSR